MYILNIEHAVPSYERWKQAFDSDPVGREKMGVKRYQIIRPTDQPDTVIINLEFETVNEAEALLNAMRQVWSQVAGTIMANPQARIMETIETKSY